MSAKYNPVTATIIAELKSIVGEKYVWTDADKLESYSHDEVSGAKYRKAPEAVVLPGTTDEVQNRQVGEPRADPGGSAGSGVRLRLWGCCLLGRHRPLDPSE